MTANLSLKIDYLPPDKIKPSPGNPRRHSAAQIAAIAASMAEHGNIDPVLIDENAVLIAGEARLEAAKLAGLDRIPVIRLRHLTSTQKRLYRIASNRLAELGTWSIPALLAEFETIELEMPSLDLQLSGFTLDQIDGHRDMLDSAVANDDGDLPEPDARSPVARLGDVWDIGPHRLICGNSTIAATYEKLLGRERPGMVFGDGPYNVRIAGNVSGLGKTRHREFVQASGEMSDPEFSEFILAYMLHCARYAKPGALQYFCSDWRGIRLLLSAGLIAFDELINVCVWTKQPGMGSLYRSAHEIIAVFKKGKGPHRNNVKLGSNGRNRSNVWAYAGMTSPTKERTEALALHPTVKPVAMVRDAILDVTARGDIVLDPFGGSGTTLLAAHRVGRVARLIELDPLYCDVILRRAAKTLNIEPTLDGQPFAQVVELRLKEAAHGE